jgi:hypothetical protein
MGTWNPKGNLISLANSEKRKLQYCSRTYGTPCNPRKMLAYILSKPTKLGYAFRNFFYRGFCLSWIHLCTDKRELYILRNCQKLSKQHLNVLLLGTREERGLVAWEAQFSSSQEDSEGDDSNANSTSCYDFPIGMSLLRKWGDMSLDQSFTVDLLLATNVLVYIKPRR